MKSDIDAALEEMMILQRALLDSDDASDDLSIVSPQLDRQISRNHSNFGDKRGGRSVYDTCSQRQVDGKSERHWTFYLEDGEKLILNV